jgi:hypothetical protein
VKSSKTASTESFLLKPMQPGTLNLMLALLRRSIRVTDLAFSLYPDQLVEAFVETEKMRDANMLDIAA